MLEKIQLNSISSKVVETSINEINTVESFISKILVEENFSRLNYLQNRRNAYESEKFVFKINDTNHDLQFISINTERLSPFATILSEKEFLLIVGKVKNGLSKRSGKYQQSLFSNYLQALDENDEGYLSDVLNKAVIFKNNLNYVKSLMKDKLFMKNWIDNFGKESPLFIFKTTGNLKQINIVKERMV